MRRGAQRAAWLLAAALLVAGVSPEAAPPPEATTGTMEKDAAWRGTVRVEGTLTVASGAALTVTPGTVVLFGKDAALVVEGKLVAEGTTAEPIRFEAGASPPAAGRWAGIRFAGARAGSVMSNCRVSGAGSVHLTGSSPAIRKCAIADGITGIVVERNSAPEIDGNEISGMVRSGIVVEKDSAPSVSGNRVRSCAVAGIAAADGAAPALRGNTVSECGIGIGFVGVIPPVEGNVIRGNKQGMAVRTAGPGQAIRGNRFLGNEAALVCAQFSSPLIERNEFTGNGDALVCSRASSPLVRNNEFANNRQGILCVNISAPRIVANEIRGNRKGIVLTLSSYAAVNGNNIHGNEVQLELGNMSSDWERKVGKKPSRGTRAQAEELVGRGRATAQALADVGQGDGAVIMGVVDATGNWWGDEVTREMEKKGPDADIASLVDWHDVPVRTYEGYPGEYVQDRIKYEGWRKTRVGDAGIR